MDLAQQSFIAWTSIHIFLSCDYSLFDSFISFHKGQWIDILHKQRTQRACYAKEMNRLTSSKATLKTSASLVNSLRTNQATHVVLLGVHGHVLFLQFHHYIHVPLVVFHFIQGSRNVSSLEHLTEAEEKWRGDWVTAPHVHQACSRPQSQSRSSPSSRWARSLSQAVRTLGAARAVCWAQEFVTNDETRSDTQFPLE